MTNIRIDEYWTDRISKDLFDKVFRDDEDFVRRYTMNPRKAEDALIRAVSEAKYPIPFDLRISLAKFYSALMTSAAEDYDGPKTA